MKSNFTRVSLLFMLLISFFTLQAQEEIILKPIYNSKRNFVMLNGSIGGGDYPFGGMGLTLTRQFFNGETYFGVTAQYIGTTITNDWEGLDFVQVFPVMAEARQLFSSSKDNRFGTYIILDAGYVISITGDQTDEQGAYQFLNGWAINPGVSFRFNIFENIGVMADISWFHHESPRVWYAPVEKRDVKSWNEGMVRWSVFF